MLVSDEFGNLHDFCHDRGFYFFYVRNFVFVYIYVSHVYLPKLRMKLGWVLGNCLGQLI